MSRTHSPFILILLILVFCTILSTSSAQDKIEQKYESQVFENKDKTYGYKIIVNGKAMIKQESMPALPGVKGFPRKIDAERMANLVIHKLKNNIMPPTVSVSEVDSVRAMKK